MRKKNGYLDAVVKLVGGSMVAQVFTVLCAPLLTRMFKPEELGVYSLVSGAVTMFGTAMSWRYDMIIVSEPNEDRVWPLIKLAGLICVLMSTVIAIGYYAYFLVVSSQSQPLSLALIAGGLVFLMGIINIITAYNNRNQDYAVIAKTYLVRTIAQNTLNLLSGFLGMGALGLSCSQLIGYAAGVRGQAKLMLKHKKQIAGASLNEVARVFSNNVRQATLSAPAAVANGLSYSLINYFIEALFTTDLVGYYSISFRILGMPSAIISTNISRIFLEKASKECSEKGSFQRTYKKTLVMMLLIAIPITAALMGFAPWACEVFFGKGWYIAGRYIQILTPMYILRFIAGGVSTSAILANKQQFDLVVQVILVLCSAGTFFLTKIFAWPIETFLMVLNTSFSIVYIAYIWLFWRCAKGKWSGIDQANDKAIECRQ